MDNNVKGDIAKYIEDVGVDMATEVAVRILSVNAIGIGKSDKQDNISIAQIKYHTSVLEYLYCDSDIVDGIVKAMQ